MSKKEWGNITWEFFHSLAEKINDIYFLQNKREIITLVNQIILTLPCPSCSHDAELLLRSINFNKIINKNDFKLFLFNLHNNVNKKIGNIVYNESILEKYKNKNIYTIIRMFKNIFFSRKYNESLLLDSFRNDLAKREILIKLTKLINNNAFN